MIKRHLGLILSVFFLLCFSGTAAADGYSTDIINQTQWINVDDMDLGSTSGVFLFIASFVFMIFCVIMAEVITIPALKVAVGIIAMLYSIFLYTVISALFGVMGIILAFSYILYGVFSAR